MTRGIIWLSSYPKSGNTWFRIFLNNLFQDGETPASINNMQKTPIASAREIFDEAMGFEASELTADEIDRLRPDLYTHLAQVSEEQLFMKIHDAYTILSDGQPLIPQTATDSAIYFIRNPLDVAVSFAHHCGWSYDQSVASMADNAFAFCSKADRLHSQLRQMLLSWSNHVLSWVDRAPFPVCVLRYEDMHSNPLETFSRAVRFARLNCSEEEIQKACEFSSFEKIREQENQEGFKEKSAAADRFFRKGKIGSWRDELTDDQAGRIVRDHQGVMRRFGYLNDRGDIVY